MTHCNHAYVRRGRQPRSELHLAFGYQLRPDRHHPPYPYGEGETGLSIGQQNRIVAFLNPVDHPDSNRPTGFFAPGFPEKLAVGENVSVYFAADGPKQWLRKTTVLFRFHSFLRAVPLEIDSERHGVPKK